MFEQRRALKEKNELIQKHEEYCMKTVSKISQYFSKLHNILQTSERNTLLYIKQDDIKFKNNISSIENQITNNIKNFESMILSLQSSVMEAKKVHLKKLADSTKKYLECVATPPLFPKLAKNPFEIIENEDLEKLLKEFCPYKVIKETEESNKFMQMASKNFEFKKNETLLDETENPLMSSIIRRGQKFNQKYDFPDEKILDMVTDNTKLSIPQKSNNKESRIKIQKAKVSHFNDPLHFYVQFDSYSLTENLLNAECTKDAKIAETPNKININHLYLIKTKSNVWERGKILEEVKSQTYRVLLIDTGETVFATKQQIIVMSKALQSKEAGAEKCSIFGIKQKESEKEWSDEAKVLAKNLLLKKLIFVAILKKDKDVLYVDLISKDNYPTSFRNALIFTDIAEEIYIDNKELANTVRYYNNYKMKELIAPLNRSFYPINVTELAEIKIRPLNVISPSEFYVAQHESTKEMENLKLELKENYSKNFKMIYCPRKNMQCAVEINENWYRCKVINVHEKCDVDVFLVDEGRSETVRYTQLSFLEKSHCIINEYSFRCSLIDIEPFQSNNLYWTSEALVDFQRIMKHSNLKILIHTINQKNHSVTLKIIQKQREMNVNALLVEYKHAISTGPESVDVTTFKTKSLVSFSKEKDNLKEKISKNIKTTINPEGSLTAGGSVSLNQNSSNFQREEIIVTHIESPGEFYIQLEKFCDGIIKLHKFLQKYQEQILSENPEYQIKYNWKINDNCLVFLCLSETTVKEWYRGNIIDIKECKTSDKRNISYTVYLRDHGKKIENICNEQLSPIRSCDARICNATTKCHLACVKPTGGTGIWSKAAKDQLKSYISKYEKLYATVQGENVNNSIPVILWGFCTEVSDALSPTIYKYVNINKTLHSLGFAQLVERFDRDKQIMKLTDVINQNEIEDLEQIMKSVDLQIEKESNEMKQTETVTESESELENSDFSDNDDSCEIWPQCSIDKTLFTAYPTYVDYNGCIYLHDATKESLLEKIKKYLNKKFKNHINTNNEITDFQPGEACIARYHGDSLYYRAEIISVSNDVIQVCFVDYGNVEECNKDEIIRKTCFKKTPRLAVKYELYGIEPNALDGKWTKDTLDLMHILIVTKLCCVTVKTTKKETSTKQCSIKIDALDLSEYLIEQNLARRIQSNLPENSTKESDNSCTFLKYLDNNKGIENIEEANSNIVKYDDYDTKYSSNNSTNLIANTKSNSSSEDEAEVWLNKQKLISNINKKDFFEYKEIFQKEELNKFCASVISKSKSTSFSADEVDFDCTFQSWSEKDRPITNPYKAEESVSLLSDEKDNDLSSMEPFDPIDTSTVVPRFDGMENFKYYQLPYGLKEFYCEVYYIDNLTKFFISPVIADLQKQYIDMMKRIQAFVKSSRSNMIDIEPKKPCLALFNEDGMYYRSIIKEIHPTLNKAEVLYVDYFNTDCVPFSNIRKCPNEFMNYPLRILPVQLRKIKPNPRWRESDIKSILSETLNGKKIFVEVIKLGKIPEVQFFVSNNNRSSILKDFE
ncbi:RING finger protein 17-like [Condylostylus longicornis]|uniref:RING finger protein 17-like n=1 Tax=Condylostylus longicornis TaxID=2530218 RepID=UPI00244DE085|nr:RING finger protein 17-like [Condylostylus longicornis]